MRKRSETHRNPYANCNYSIAVPDETCHFIRLDLCLLGLPQGEGNTRNVFRDHAANSSADITFTLSLRNSRLIYRIRRAVSVSPFRVISRQSEKLEIAWNWRPLVVCRSCDN